MQKVERRQGLRLVQRGLAEGRKEGRASGIAEGRREEKLDNARAMLRGGISSERVADILKLSESDMKEVMNLR